MHNFYDQLEYFATNMFSFLSNFRSNRFISILNVVVYPSYAKNGNCCNRNLCRYLTIDFVVVSVIMIILLNKYIDIDTLDKLYSDKAKFTEKKTFCKNKKMNAASTPVAYTSCGRIFMNATTFISLKESIDLRLGNIF